MTQFPPKGTSLAALAAKNAMMEWESPDMPEAPSPPETLKETGLNEGMLIDLLIKTLMVRGTVIGKDLAIALCLSFKVIEESLMWLKEQKCVDSTGAQTGALIGPVGYKFNLTE